MADQTLPPPTFAELSSAALESLLPDLTAGALRSAVLAEKRMHSHLVRSLVGATKGPALSDEQQSAVSALLSKDLPSLHLQLGATYFANHLAVAVAKRQLVADEKILTRDVIRIALRHRNLALPHADEDATPSLDKMSAEGELCLWTWLDTLSTEAAELLRLRFDQPETLAKPASLTRRKRIVSKVLAAMSPAQTPAEAS